LNEFKGATGDGAAALTELRPLGFGRCRLSLAVPQDMDYRDATDLAGLRIATSYPGLLSAWLREKGVDAVVVTLAGSVEIAPKLGTADAICDLVQSGGTLVANQLRETDVLLQSEAVLAGPEALPADERGDMIDLLLKRLDGVIQVRESRLLLLQTSLTSLDAVTRLLPGGPQPTLLPVAGQPDQLMLQALCAGEVSWRQLEEIKKAGAREMFVLPVEKMLA
ncbi:MAG TPA: ATP phosphoribosyltransferase, partial [Dyella sp.]|nr:ATP phosphoribosyltransferase [Dyella sp.]